MGKKEIRASFRNACYARDKYKCAMCSFKSSPEKAEQELDAHHITDRKAMPSGGYVSQNGISLCAPCHLKAEEFHSTGKSHPGYSPEDLYKKIGSDHKAAVDFSNKLKS